MQFTDTVTIEGTRIRQDGYLVADARVARTGIQRYLGTEVGRPDLPFVDVYRSPEEVFSADSMKSFAHIPVTDDHPTVAVNADNSRELARGWTSDEIARDGERLRVPLMVSDGAAIQKVQAGKRELSAGYTCELVWGDGLTEDGEPFQAKQTNIRANHVAIVARGRAGKDVRIGDSAYKWGTAPITDAHDRETTMSMRTVLVDGLSVETTDAGAQAIAKLQSTIDGMNKKMSAAEEEADKKMTKKDADLSALQAKLDDAVSKVLDQSAIDRLVTGRVALEATAARIAKDVKPLGLSDAALKATVVKAKLGDKLPADRFNDQAYIDARFDILAEDAGKTTDTFRDARVSPSNHRFTIPANMSDAQRQRQQAFDGLLHFDQTGSELDH